VATSPTASGSCLATTTELHVIAQNTDYDTDCLAVGPDIPFTIEFENRDDGTQHNIVIREGAERNVFEGEIVTGPATTTYQVEPIAAGEYRFFCIVHPLQMAGAFLVGFE
jgi:plastocyanin